MLSPLVCETENKKVYEKKCMNTIYSGLLWLTSNPNKKFTGI